VRDDMPLWLLVAEPILLGGLIYFTFHYVAELRFYRKHKWDFSVPNPKGKKMYYGRVAATDDSNLISNERRIWFGYPFFVFVLGFIFIGFTYCIYRIQTCPYSDLKLCSIEIANGKVTLH
jgi:hypothetical protein